MSQEDFSAFELAVGTTKGLRAFDVDSLGRLTGVTHKAVWRPGENVAECRRSRRTPQCAKAHDDMISMFAYHGAKPRMPAGWPHTPQCFDSTPCLGLEPNCECGFYAFYNGANDYRQSSRVSAVIEGYGRTVVGTRGFRAEKAKIVALCLPGLAVKATSAAAKPKKSWWDRLDSAVVWLGWVAAGAKAIATALDFSVANLIGSGGAIALAIVLTVVARRSRTSRRATTVSAAITVDFGEPSLSRSQLERVCRNYPDVPAFSTVKEMLAAHPLDGAQRVTPESDPDFWTRSAS